jgi:hypothetical protein
MAALLPVCFLVPGCPVKSLMHVVTGPAGQGIEVNITFLEMIVLLQILPVTAVTGCNLLVGIFHRVDFDVNGMAGRAIDVLAVVGTAVPFDHRPAAFFFMVTGETGINLRVPRRKIGTAAKIDHFREARAAVRARNMNAARAMTGFTALCREWSEHVFHVAVSTVFYRAHPVTGVTAQANFGPAASINLFPVGGVCLIRILCECRCRDQANQEKKQGEIFHRTTVPQLFFFL